MKDNGNFYLLLIFFILLLFLLLYKRWFRFGFRLVSVRFFLKPVWFRFGFIKISKKILRKFKKSLDNVNEIKYIMNVTQKL